ncbi:unnamed protein product [Rhizoctonia solani]|uniref:Protein kinase domain-containing protein n=1 Tax=Rhizoctonia solani TaxID=456999 RepID=A0A8H3H6Q7_9AGAM|nr:unnamed protein product [Rhizoctonia solani]
MHHRPAKQPESMTEDITVTYQPDLQPEVPYTAILPTTDSSNHILPSDQPQSSVVQLSSLARDARELVTSTPSLSPTSTAPQQGEGHNKQSTRCPSPPVRDAKRQRLRGPDDTDESEDDQEYPSKTPTVKLRAPEIPKRLPGACINCKRLKMKCVFVEGADVCQRCEQKDRPCVIEYRRRGPVPSKRELLMREIAIKDQLINSLLTKLNSPVIHTSDNWPPTFPALQQSEDNADGLHDHNIAALMEAVKKDKLLAPTSPTNRACGNDDHALLVPETPFDLSAEPTADDVLRLGTGTSNMKRKSDGHSFEDLYSIMGLVHGARGHVATSMMTCADIITTLTGHGCANLTASLDESACSNYPIATGGVGDVFFGGLHNGTSVAIKAIQAYHDPGNLVRVYHKRVAKEMYMWSKCSHPNLVELIGLAMFHDRLAVISRWEANGNLLQYLSRHPSADRCHLKIKSTSVCAGLTYLHDQGIVHCNLKGANILIAQDGRPMLIDFGNISVLDAAPQFTEIHTGIRFSLRWAAPELLLGTSSHTTASDVYSLGMAIMETFTSQIPFGDKSEMSLPLHVVVQRKIPSRPEKLVPERSVNGNTLWSILTKCWSYDPKDRPSARDVWEGMMPITLEALKETEYRLAGDKNGACEQS